tara:strand:+ start:821 stop:1018 length:198 start_codon:yes stop_codon:yes gene_type:complete
MKKKILVRNDKGEFGHAELIGENERNNIHVSHYEVRMLHDYEHVHIHSVPTFFIYYEVLDDYEGD